MSRATRRPRASTTEERAARWAERLNPLVEHCENDQPYDPEEEELIWVQGDRTGVGDFLADHAVPEALHEAVVAELQCRDCGREGFDLWDDIGLETDEEREHRERWARWDRRYSARVEDFARHLEAYPYLGLAHPLGRQIHAAIRTYPRTELGKHEWWRARKADGARRFVPKDMAPPPPSKATSEGRFNHYGQVVFYLASAPEAALSETLDTSRGDALGWVQQFSVPQKTEVLNLVAPEWYRESGVPILALGLMHRMPNLQPDPRFPWKPEYFLPRFVADCARAEGIAGIVFESRKYVGQNLALFKWTRSRVRARGAPRLEVLPGSGDNDFADGVLDFDF